MKSINEVTRYNLSYKDSNKLRRLDKLSKSQYKIYNFNIP